MLRVQPKSHFILPANHNATPSVVPVAKANFGCRFAREERGSVMVIFAIALPVVIGIAGLAVDYSRSTLLRRHLVNAADAAAIVATKAVGDGKSIADATSLAQAYWKANADRNDGHVATPTVAITEVANIVTATVSYTATIDTTLGSITGVKVMNVGGSATAQASSVKNASKTYSGSGGIWGDPHLVGADGHNTEFMCPRPSWYDMLSDGGIEVNIGCKSYPTYDLVSDISVILGGHKITMTSAMLDNKSGTMPQPGWTNEVRIDGTVFAPKMGKTELANWTEGTITAVIDTTNYLNTSYSDTSNRIEITTPQYTIVLGFAYASGYGSWGWTTITAKNAGVCGVPGGLFGQTLGGIDSYTMSDYAVASASATQSAFNRQPCPVVTASGVRLIR